MTAALATQSGLPGTLREDGYELPPGMPFEEWEGVLDTLQNIERAVKWWVGDAILYGEATYGQDASQAFPDAFSGSPYAESTLRAAAWVSTAFPRGTRVMGASWTHHRIVADLPAEDAQALLQEAVSEHLPTRDLIDRARERKDAIRAEAMVGSSAPVCAADQVWHPTAEDLTDEARRALDFKAAEVGRRHGIGFAAGWIAALRWAEQRDCFTEWRD